MNGSGTKSGTGGAGGQAGADTNPFIGESKTPLSTSINDGHEFNYTIVFNGSELDPILYFMDEKTITVPDYVNVPTGKQFMGWKVKTYGKTLEASADNPLTTAEDVLYQPNSSLTIKQGTYGNIVLVPVLEDLPTNAASDTLTLTTLGSSQLYEYTLKVTNNGQAADLGTFVFHGNDGNKNVNSQNGDNLGIYKLTLAQNITISSIDATDLGITGVDFTTDADGVMHADFSSMEVGVKGKIVGDVKVKDSTNEIALTYNSSLSTNDTTVFSYFTQGNGDSKDYTIVVDGEEIPTATAKFGTRATINYSTVNVTLKTNVDNALTLYLKNADGNKILLENNGVSYSAINLLDNKEYTLFINDYNANKTITLNQSTIEETVDYYEINIVSKVDGAEHETNHEIRVNGVKAKTFDNTNFKAIALSTKNCAITSNDISVITITPSTTLATTDIDYYTVKYLHGANTLPLDSNLYLSGQDVIVASTDGLSASASDKYVAGWTDNSKNYYGGDKLTITEHIVLTSFEKTDDLIINYVDHYGNVGTDKKLPFNEKIVVKEWPNLKNSFDLKNNDETVTIPCYFVGWRLDVDQNNKIYSIGEETEFTPKNLLGSETSKTVQFNAVYSLSNNPFTVVGTYTYDKTAKTPVLSNSFGFTTNDYEILFEDGVDHTSAGNNIPFKVHFKGNYAGVFEDVPMTFNIGKCPITVTPNSEQSKIYGENDRTLEYSLSSALFTGDSLSGTLSRVEGENVGTYEITLGNLNNDNYALTLDNTPVVFTINPKSTLTNADLTITGTYTYTGSEIIPTYTVKDGTKTLDKDTDYTVEFTNNINASTTDPTVTITLKGNYSGTLTKSFEIGKASITPDILLDGWTYGEIANNPSVSGNSGDGEVTYQYKVKDADDSTYSNDVPTAAGTYVVKATIAITSNYLGATKTKEFTIEKKEVDKPVEDTTNFIYTGSEQTYAIADNSLYNVSNNKRTDAGTQNVSISLTDKNNYKWTDSNSDDLTYTFTIAKATGTITVDTTTITKTYGETVDLPVATSNFGSVSCDKTSDALVNAGTYTVTYTLAETDNYTGDTKTLTVIINKVPINPKITIKSFNKGDTWVGPTISDNISGGVEIVKYKAKNALDSTYTADYPTEVGTYTVKLTVEETDNYLGATATCDFAIYTNPSSPGQIITAVVNTNTEITDTKLDPISETEAAQILGTEGKLGDFAQALTNPVNKVTIFTEVEAPSDLTAFEALNITNDNAVLLDINLYAMLNNDYANKEQITDTNGYKTTVSITLTPEQASKINIANNKNYFVLRKHDDDIEKIPASLEVINDNYVFTFETDKFSAYAIYSENKPAPRYVVPNTGVEGTSTNNHSLLKLSSLSLLTIGTYLVIKKKKEND